MNHYLDSRLVAIRKARLYAEECEANFQAFRRLHGSPRSIAGERHTAEIRAEYRRLEKRAEDAANDWAELKANVQ